MTQAHLPFLTLDKVWLKRKKERKKERNKETKKQREKERGRRKDL